MRARWREQVWQAVGLVLLICRLCPAAAADAKSAQITLTAKWQATPTLGETILFLVSILLYLSGDLYMPTLNSLLKLLVTRQFARNFSDHQTVDDSATK